MTTMIDVKWRRGWDSNPRCVAASPVFKTGSLNRSDTSPLESMKHAYYSRAAQAGQERPPKETAKFFHFPIAKINGFVYNNLRCNALLAQLVRVSP